MRTKANTSLVYCVLLSGVVAILFLTGAPSGGAFSWQDSPRHALNGAFVMDLIRAAPFEDPGGFARDYYTQYPALTILFYPPLFSFFLAPFYAALGVSQESALVALFVCYVFLACGTYFFSRQWLSRPVSFGVALILVAAPEVTYWGRQVMLEIPAFALLVWSAYFLVRHVRERRVSFLYLSTGLLVLSAYTKISVLFVAVPYVLVLLHARGGALSRDKHSYVITALAIIGALPLLFLTVKFGQANVQSVSGVADSQASRLAISGWTWYARQLPSQIGWPALIVAVAFVGVGGWRWRRREAGREAPGYLLLYSWFVVGYLFFSAIDLKEARHSIFLLLPAAVFAGLTCERLLPNRGRAAAAAIAVGCATMAISVLTRPVDYVDGYKEVVEFVAARSPPSSNILFSGYRDGAFIFNMRAHSERPDVSVVRADKLLLRISVRRDLGVEERDYTEAEIGDLIDGLGVHYVVAQPDFWTDIEQMALLQSVLRGARFEEVRRFEMVSNYPAQEKELLVYRNLGDVAKGPIDITNELPIIDRKITGTVSKN